MGKIHYIYEIPSHDNYVGRTIDLGARKRNHKRLGKDISRINVLKAFTSKQEAIAYERMLQEEQGFSGNNYSADRNNKISIAKTGPGNWMFGKKRKDTYKDAKRQK